MTLRTHYLHNDRFQTNEIKNQKIIKSTECDVNAFLINQSVVSTSPDISDRELKREDNKN